MTRNNLLEKFDRSPHALRMTPSIVVGMDASAASREALRWAADQSRLTGLPLRVVHAWEHSDGLGATTVGITGYAEAFVADARARLTRLILDTLGDGAVDVRWTLEIVEGAAGPVLVARSRSARTLVLGTGEHTGLHRLVPGSVSHYCLSHAVSPVVAVPAVNVSLTTVGASSGGSLPM
jgi:nucleotide-binding universal stress UspA family protein